MLVELSGFGASSIDLLVSAYLRTADMTRFLQMQNDLYLDLMDVMQKNGVDFAFPSTTVYLEKNSEHEKRNSVYISSLPRPVGCGKLIFTDQIKETPVLL